MSDEAKEMINRLAEIRQEHKRDRYNTHSYILFAVALSTLGLSLSSFRRSDAILFLVFALIFVVWALVLSFRARKVKV